MERAWLERELAKGRSIESLARQLGRHPSTVAYWMRKHGLVSVHAARHQSRGGIDRQQLERLVADGLTVRQIAAELDRSVTTVRHWLRRYGQRTRASMYRSDDPAGSGDGADAGGARTGEIGLRRCRRHGWSRFVRTRGGHVRCVRCRSDAVSKRRRRVKSILVEEAGGCCVLCGYDRHVGALQFHHVDPATKRFTLAGGGLARSIESARREAAKCVLLCANCHAEVEAGVATIPLAGPPDGSVPPELTG